MHSPPMKVGMVSIVSLRLINATGGLRPLSGDAFMNGKLFRRCRTYSLSTDTSGHSLAVIETNDCIRFLERARGRLALGGNGPFRT